ncbi:hypothetical protein HS088_TW11G00508 [Tripterygium wilfordii]|uniref:Uncharacterized protein n=1 Tax=Tripterygium wilfordii TaxID=458696 RepID=A0A7J7D2G9_TRIWF|nr:hypothetical protein HS088_TW11G00508 [Tripterygium wilfordii]
MWCLVSISVADHATQRSWQHSTHNGGCCSMSQSQQAVSQSLLHPVKELKWHLPLDARCKVHQKLLKSCMNCCICAHTCRFVCECPMVTVYVYMHAVVYECIINTNWTIMLNFC